MSTPREQVEALKEAVLLAEHATNLGRAAASRRAGAPPEDPPAKPPADPVDAIDRRIARRLFAAAALTGLIASTEPGARWPTPYEAAARALAHADAILALEDETANHHEAQG